MDLQASAIAQPGRDDLSRTLAAYFALNNQKPDRYAGQATDAFQRDLAEYHSAIVPSDCDFYHTIELPNGTVLAGDWDLRDYEPTYLGDVDVSGKRVIEFGPASGSISAYIARRATLTIVDLPFDRPPEFVPHPTIDMVSTAASATASARRLRNSWWFARQQLRFEAKAIYADIYQLPTDVGRHDIAFFGAILLHLSSPFRALEQAAAVTDEAIIVSDVDSSPKLAGYDAAAESSAGLTVFNPTEPPFGMTHWWAVSPGMIAHMLRRLGFPHITVTRHTPPRMSSKPPMFTVVGRRSPVLDTGTRWNGVPVPVPPPPLRFAVSGTEDLGTFLQLGRRGFDAIGETLAACGEDRSKLDRVLDFGCGVGRVLRYWAEVPDVQVEGTDLSGDAITWAQANLPFASFGTNDLAAILPMQSRRFGLIYALSVFTHLPTSMQMPWLAELNRVARPGGLVYITTHGTRYRHLLNEAEQAAFDRGEVVVTGDESPGSNHCAAFHPPAWIEQAATSLGWEVLEHKPCGARGNPDQDSWLFRSALHSW